MLLRATMEESTKGGASALASEMVPMFYQYNQKWGTVSVAQVLAT